MCEAPRPRDPKGGCSEGGDRERLKEKGNDDRAKFAELSVEREALEQSLEEAVAHLGCMSTFGTPLILFFGGGQ